MVSCFLEDTSPFLLSLGQHSEHRLQTLAVQLGLVIQILKDECKLLTNWNALHCEVKVGTVPIFLVGSTIVANP